MSYWKRRFQLIEDASNKRAMETVQSITPSFDQAQAQIQKEIDAWYARFAKNNQITMQEAKKLLNTKELKEFHWDVQEYIKFGRENAIDQKWMKELENASARFHVSRLEALKIRTQNAAERAFGNELDQIDRMAANIYMDDYYHTAYEIQRGLGIGFDVGQIDQRKLDSLISKPWTSDDKTFKDRIWTQKSSMISELHDQMTRMCVLGRSPDEAIREMEKFVDKKVKNTKYAAGRLVMTESAFFASAAQKDCFNDLDVEKYEVVATLDSHTSEICQQMDGQVLDMKDFQPGVTAPPFHVFCRSCTCPWFEDNDDGTRAARNADGQTYYVPADMKYEDWKNSFVDGGSKEGLKPVDNVENLRKLIAEKESEIEGLKRKVDETNAEQKDYHDGLNRYKKYHGMSDEDFEKYVEGLAKKEADLTAEVNKLGADIDRYYDRPRRRTPEREEWDKWVSENRIDINDLNDRYYPLEDERLKVEAELKETSEFKDFRTKFKGKSDKWYKDQVDSLTSSQNTLQSEIEDLKKQLVEALKNRPVGDSYKERIQQIKDVVSANGGTVTEEDLQEAGRLFQEELLKDAQYTERVRKVTEAKEQMDSTYQKYRSTQQEINDLKKKNPELVGAIDEYESMQWWTEHRPDNEDFARRFKEAEEKIKQIDSRYFELKKSEHELHELYKQQSGIAYDAKKDYEYKNAEDVKRILSQVREMGSDGIDIRSHLSNSRSEVAKYVEQAYSYYPKEWVQSSVKYGKMKPKKVQRGYYGGSEIAISGSGVHAFSTSIHELGHRMESVFPAIKNAEKLFYARRTAGEDLKWLGSGYRRDEKTRKDDFLHPYMGKDYGGTWYELVSMGFEMGYTDPARLMKDPDMANWIYGILSLL